MPFGENARKYYESHFAKGRMIDKLEHELEAACGDTRHSGSVNNTAEDD